MKNLVLFLCLLNHSFYATAQCLEEIPGIVWKSTESKISFEDLAVHVAPMLWFSPDEIKLYDAQGHKQLPNAFPFETTDGKPVVYYKISNIYTQDKELAILNLVSTSPNFRLLDLQKVKAIDLDYYYYFEEETGLGSHPHDIESITLQITILEAPDCVDFNYAISVKKVTGRAHGLNWYNNELEVDAQTFFPLSILIEEGKHASCTDKNADGVYTPTYDVTERVNDAWGVRDIITSGKLVTPSFQAWMAKNRTPSTIVFPPFPESSPYYQKYVQKFGDYITDSQYELRPYPNYEKVKKEKRIDSSLDHLMKNKKPHQWPDINKVSGNGKIKQWAKTDDSYKSVSVAYRWDDSNGLSFAMPLLLFKNVEAPMTGGWFYNKFYFGLGDSFVNDSINLPLQRLFGHQIVHTSSAAKWVDSYIGLGYEFLDTNNEAEKFKYKAYFTSELGIKIRVNISKTPLKFLTFIGPDFWGVRLGWKNVGFNPFVNSGFVLSVGAGVF